MNVLAARWFTVFFCMDMDTGFSHSWPVMEIGGKMVRMNCLLRQYI